MSFSDTLRSFRMALENLYSIVMTPSSSRKDAHSSTTTLGMVRILAASVMEISFFFSMREMSRSTPVSMTVSFSGILHHEAAFGAIKRFLCPAQWKKAGCGPAGPPRMPVIPAGLLGRRAGFPAGSLGASREGVRSLVGEALHLIHDEVVACVVYTQPALVCTVYLEGDRGEVDGVKVDVVDRAAVLDAQPGVLELDEVHHALHARSAVREVALQPMEEIRR